MKKLLLLTIACLIFTAPRSYAESWDDYADLDRAWDGQKTITNKEFEQAMDTLQAKQKKREARQKKRRAKKISGGGTSLHNELNPDKDIQEIKLTNQEDGILVNLPINIYIDGKKLDKGYYKVTAKKDSNNKIFIEFYQSYNLCGSVEAHETEEDFGENTVDFAKVTPYNDSFVKVIFGSIDFNAYAYIPFSE